MSVKNIYLYVKKSNINKCIKYGIKLSEYADISFIKNTIFKKGILCFISPKDSEKYFDDNYDILRLKTDDLNIYVHNSSLVSKNIDYEFDYNKMKELNKYILGDYINPELLLYSTVLPESIYKYNRIIDVPLLVDNSKEFYLSKEMETENENLNNNISFNMLKST